jgi:DNA-binding PadR family transcriptional regulator
MTNAELAVLSLIAEKPRHGYEIEQVIQEREMREWTEVGFSSIYYLLKKLEREGLIEGRLAETEHGPARKVYRPTPAGWEAARAAVLEALSVPHRGYQSFHLGLANLPGIAPGEAVAALQHYRDELAAGRDRLRSRRDAQGPLPYFVEAMFDHTITMIGAEAAWVERFIKRMETQGPMDAVKKESDDSHTQESAE